MLGNIRLALAKKKRDQLILDINNSKGFKKKQLQIKLYDLERKYFPKLFWDSKKLGTYRKNNNEKK